MSDKVNSMGFEAITPADYHRDDPVPTPAVFQKEGVEYCTHNHLKGNCRHKECKHYAPHKDKK